MKPYLLLGNKVVAVLALSLFALSALGIVFADFSSNRGTTKPIVLLYFTLSYVWYIIGSIAVQSSKISRWNDGLLFAVLLVNIMCCLRLLVVFMELLDV
jgi:hypothetical protein